jgi:hypothetical protein
MVRIGGSTEKGEHIKESDYYTPSGEFRYLQWRRDTQHSDIQSNDSQRSIKNTKLGMITPLEVECRVVHCFAEWCLHYDVNRSKLGPFSNIENIFMLIKRN